MDKNIICRKISGMLGLARRAGKITFGFDAVLKDIAAGKAEAVFLSADASERTAGKIKKTCADFEIPAVMLPIEKKELGWAIGKDGTAVIAVLDKSFSSKLKELAGADMESDAGRQQN